MDGSNGLSEAEAEFVAFAQSRQPELLRVAHLVCGDVGIAQGVLRTGASEQDNKGQATKRGSEHGRLTIHPKVRPANAPAGRPGPRFGHPGRHDHKRVTDDLARRDQRP